MFPRLIKHTIQIQVASLARVPQALVKQRPQSKAVVGACLTPLRVLGSTTALATAPTAGPTLLNPRASAPASTTAVAWRAGLGLVVPAALSRVCLTARLVVVEARARGARA